MRLKSSIISTELRTKLAATALGATLAEIPNGRDPRSLQQNDTLPMMMVHLASTITVPHGIGGSGRAHHGVAIYYVFRYQSTDSIAEIKELVGEQIFEFLADNWNGDHYALFLNEVEGSAASGWPSIDYSPREEMFYEGHRIAMMKVELALRQKAGFTLEVP